MSKPKPLIYVYRIALAQALHNFYTAPEKRKSIRSEMTERQKKLWMTKASNFARGFMETGSNVGKSDE